MGKLKRGTRLIARHLCKKKTVLMLVVRHRWELSNFLSLSFSEKKKESKIGEIMAEACDVFGSSAMNM